MQRALVLAIVLCGCSAPPEQPPYQPPSMPAHEGRPPALTSPPGPAVESGVASSPVVSATCVGMWWGKPPLKAHFFDVRLNNPAEAPRWLILPETFPYAGAKNPAPGQGDMAELQIYQLAKQPRVLLGMAVALGSFWAVKLPARGTLTLRQLRIESWWDRVPKGVALEVIVAREISAGDQVLGELFGVDPLSESGADVKAPRDAADQRSLRFWHGKDDKSVPISFDEESRARLQVPLDCGTEI